MQMCVTHAVRRTRPHWAVLALFCLVAACTAPPPGPPPSPPPATPVEFVALEASPVERVSEFVGTLKSRRSTTIQAQAEGFLVRILVSSGERVTPGTPMFEIDASAQRALVSSLEAQQVAREADIAFARQQAERATQLVAAGAMSQQELDQATTSLKTAEAQLQVIEQQIRQQEVELGYYAVVAQTAGVVGDVPVRPGDRVTRTTVLTTVDDNVGLEAYLNIPVQQAPSLRVGLPVRLVDDGGEVLADTHISFVAASVDHQTQSVLVKAPVNVRPGLLRADQFVRAHVVWSVDSGLSVAVRAVQRVNDQRFVFVAEESDGGLVARQRAVVLGPVIGDAYVVLDGLTEGDLVVVSGTQKIGDGAPIQMLPPQSSADSVSAGRPAEAQ
jgi:RND family efflux transporter MFP subunit